MGVSHQLKIKFIDLLGHVFSERFVQTVLVAKYIKNYARAGIIFIHIPRCAGSSIAACIYGRRNGHLKVDVIRQAMGMRYDTLPSFTVTRNPYQRLQSAYRFARAGSISDGAIRKLDIYQSRKFATFDRFVTEWLPQQDLKSVDPVFAPQVEFIATNKGIDVNQVLKIEQEQVLEEYLTSLLRRRISLPRLNVNDVYPINREISDNAKSVICSLYRQDFEILNYDM